MGAKLCLQTGRRSNGGHVERKKECIGFFVEEMGEDVGPEEGSFCPPGGAFSLKEREAKMRQHRGSGDKYKTKVVKFITCGRENSIDNKEGEYV